MSKKKTAWLVVAAFAAVAVLAALTWIRIVSNDRQIANLNDQMQRIALSLKECVQA